MDFKGKVVYDTSKPDGRFRRTASIAKLKKYRPDFKFTPFEEGRFYFIFFLLYMYLRMRIMLLIVFALSERDPHQKTLKTSCCEPRHNKTNKVSVRPAKTQLSLGIRPV